MKKNIINTFLSQIIIVCIAGCFLTSIALAQTDDIAASRGTSPDSIEINWDKIRCASGYQVLRSINHGGPYLEKGWVEKGDPTTFTDLDAKNGRYYWYKVRPWYWIFPGESTKKVQGWVMPRMVKSNADLIGQLFTLHFILLQKKK